MKIELIKEKTLKNGDVRYTFDYDEHFIKAVCLHFNVRKATKKLIKKFVLEALEEAVVKQIRDQFKETRKLNKAE